QRIDGHAHIVALNRNIPVEPPVDQHEQFDFLRSAEMLERGNSRLDGPPRVQDIIDQDDMFVVYEKIDVSGAGLKGFVARAEIIAVKGNVELPVLHGGDLT